MNILYEDTIQLEPFAPKPGDETIICRCEEITQGEIRQAIHKGLFTTNEIKRYLRAGMGLCQGQTCNRLVRAILAKELQIPLSQVDVITPRPPARPLTLEEYANDTFDPLCLGGDGHAPQNR